MDRQHSGNKGVYAALSEYRDSDYYPYHMPGHKRSGQAGEMAGYYGIDITEIDGFDNLHHAEGILLEAQQRANRLYGAEETFYLVGGSTCGVLASVMSVAGKGEELLIARNCHKSVYHAAIMQELQLHYYYPSLLWEYGIYDGVSADGIDRMLEQKPNCKAVVITSPTYEGIVSDIRAIAEAVHRKDKILIVDEAHGAHLGLCKGMPSNAIAGGADLVVHSLHKTLPAMTQTALLHVQGERVNRKRLRRYLTMLQTSSPSYVMMASMDSCIRYMEEHGAEAFARMQRQYDIFCKKTKACRYLKIGKMTEMSQNKNQNRQQTYLAEWDIGKLVIFMRTTSLNGQQLYDILREEYHLQMEMAAGNYVVAIMTVMDTEEGWQRLADALLQIDDRIEKETARQIAGEGSKSDQYSMEKPRAVMTPAQAFYSGMEDVRLEESVGRTAADFINLYPPGIPLLVPGEVMNEDILEQVEESIRNGLQVQGVTPEGRITVVC
ncbi:MAG: PLP-dependent transferase [Lachnospiraceae bacterium]|nr:PLP-dependent transferase [Lachnospiraceae bacterium]